LFPPPLTNSTAIVKATTAAAMLNLTGTLVTAGFLYLVLTVIAVFIIFQSLYGPGVTPINCCGSGEQSCSCNALSTSMKNEFPSIAICTGLPITSPPRMPDLPNAAKILNWSRQKHFGIALIDALFRRADQQHEGVLPRTQCRHIFTNLNVSTHIIDETKGTFLGMAELTNSIAKYLPVVSESVDEMKPSDLKRFMREVQKEDHSLKECELIIGSLHDGYHQNRLPTDALARLLNQFSPKYNNFWFDINQFSKVYQDMDQPLTEYFISTSSPNFASPPASHYDCIVAIQRTLLMGCRALFLDVIDGKSEPTVLCQGAFNAGVPLEDVLRAVVNCAFVVSKHPCILAIANRCSPRQSQRVVHFLKKLLGAKLASPKLPTEKVGSPNKLKSKFLILERDVKLFGGSNILDIKARSSSPSQGIQSALSAITYIPSSVLGDIKEPGLFDSLSMCDSKACWLENEDELDLLISNAREQNVVSSGEDTRLDKKKDLLSFRPSLETSSSRCRFLGVQLCPVRFGSRVSVHHYEELHLNQGWFANNGSCGYTLKPPKSTSSLASHVGRKRTRRFSISVISGHFLPHRHRRHLSRSDLLIERHSQSDESRQWRVMVKMFGAPIGKTSDSFTTGDSRRDEASPALSLSSAHSLSPVWNDASQVNETKAFTFHPRHPETTAIYVSLFHSSNVSGVGVAQACVPIGCIRPGYRIVPLYNKRCEPLFGWLFVRVWNDYFVRGTTDTCADARASGRQAQTDLQRKSESSIGSRSVDHRSRRTSLYTSE